MTDFTTMLTNDQISAALKRMGYYGRDGKRIDEWNILNWLVRFSQKNLAASTPGDIEVLREDYRALQEVALQAFAGVSLNECLESLSITKLSVVQSSIAHHVRELVTTGKTEFGPFQTNISILFPAFDKEAPKDGPLLRFWFIDGERVDPFDGKGLLFLMARLLQRVRLAILRCPACQEVFLQPRKDARFCSGNCRASHHAAKVRTGGKRGRPSKTGVASRDKKKQGKRKTAKQAPSTARIYRA